MWSYALMAKCNIKILKICPNSVDICPKSCIIYIGGNNMKKQSIINLVKYYMEKNDEAFRGEVAEIAKDFERAGDLDLSEYLMDIISTTNYYVPQMTYKNFQYLRKLNIKNQALLLPDIIKEDVLSIVRAIQNKVGINKLLFYGAPGTGKTESAYQIARLLGRDILSVDFEILVDSRLGETAKNVSRLFDEISRVQHNKAIVVFDEIDSLVLDRINNNDMREMGRVTSVFLRNLDELNGDTVIIATTNLFKKFDKAVIRRFDATISFDRYTKNELIEIADSILSSELKKSASSKQDKRLFHKILNGQEQLPYPGDLKQLIKTAVAFSDNESEFDYLRKIYMEFNKMPDQLTIEFLQKAGYTTREIEILTKIPKSSVSRKLRS